MGTGGQGGAVVGARAGRAAGAAPLACLAALLAATGAQGQPARVLYGPPPAWVEPLPVDLAAPVPAGTRGGIDYLLNDKQVRTGPGPVERYHHDARRMLSPKGVEGGSELTVEFDPAYQQLTLHAVTIHRAGQALDALRREEVRLVQREPDLDRRLYDGRMTAVLFLRDVRPGDVVEAAFTIRGANPVFGGRWSGGFELGFGVPVGRLGVRLVSPAARPLTVRVDGLTLTPAVTRAGGLVDQRFERRSLEAIEGEDALPPGVDGYPSLEATEWTSWEEVRGWARGLFAAGGLPPAIRPQLERWRALPDEAARAQAALRLVQDEVRYLGMELGVYTHRPHAAAEVLARGFGDCKDKSLLLVSLLRELGVEAAPALVDTEGRGSIASRLPSPGVFDHAIVRARVAGRWVWLDPTRSLERSPLPALEPPGHQRALVLAPGETGLATIPEPAPALLEVVSTFQVKSFRAPVELTVVSAYSGERAVRMRHRLAEGTVADLQKGALEYYVRLYPGATVAQPLEVTDSPDADRLVVTEHYQLPAFEEHARQSFEADSIQSALARPRSSVRTLPLAVSHPVLVRERLQVKLPGPPALDPDDAEVASPAARLTRKAVAEGNGYHLDFEYRSLAAEVAVADYPRHLEALRKMNDLSSFSLRLGVARGRGSQDEDSPWPVLAVMAFLGSAGLLVVGLLAAVNGDLARLRNTWRTRRRWRAFQARLRLDTGEAPAKPVVVQRQEEILPFAAKLACVCGAPLASPPGPPQVVRYDGRELLAHNLACTRCGTSRQAYFLVRPGA